MNTKTVGFAMVIYNQIPRYEHMLPDERDIWHRFIVPRESQYIKITYDLHLGEGTIPPAGASAQLKAVVEATSKKRVDAIGETQKDITIFEVKQRAGMSALGQLLNYKQLYLKEYNPRKDVKLAIVCERLEPDILPTLKSYGIDIFIV
jgi:hypothetical protein